MIKEDIFSNNPHLSLIRGNVFDIPQRLKQIDPSYITVWNNREQRFEVHSTENIGNTYCFSVPYHELDQRTLHYARETNLAINGAKILKRIKEENERLEKEQKKVMKEKFREIGEKTWDKEFKLY